MIAGVGQARSGWRAGQGGGALRGGLGLRDALHVASAERQH